MFNTCWRHFRCVWFPIREMTLLFNVLSVCLSNVTHPRLCLSVCLYAKCDPSSFTSVCLYMCLPSVCLSFCLSVKCDPPSFMSVCLTVCQIRPTLIYVCLSVSVSNTTYPRLKRNDYKCYLSPLYTHLARETQRFKASKLNCATR